MKAQICGVECKKKKKKKKKKKEKIVEIVRVNMFCVEDLVYGLDEFFSH